MNIGITPRSIANIKAKGIDVKEIVKLYQHWTKSIKEINNQKIKL